MATSSKLLKNVGLFCRILSLLLGSFAEEIYNFREPTNRSHPIVALFNHSLSSVLRTLTERLPSGGPKEEFGCY